MKSFVPNIPVEFYAVLLFALSFALSFLMIPRLLTVVHFKKLMDDPNERSSHSFKTPTLGGVAFFASLVMSLFFMQSQDTENLTLSLIVGLTILFFVGLKDDLMVLAPRTKIITQLVAISFILLNTKMHLWHLHGFLGIEAIPAWLGIGGSYFLILAITNAYNLMDGIDGLAGLLAFVIFGAFSLIFYQAALYYYFLLAAVCMGFLLAFLRYNLSKRDKIFMGDTGSMLVGFLLGLCTLRFLAIQPEKLENAYIQPKNLVVLALALIFMMVVDTLRVMCIRLLHRKGVFSADRNHVHHILINRGLSHIDASISISLFSSFVIVLFFALNIFLDAHDLGLLLLLLAAMTVLFLFHLNTNYTALKQKVKINTWIPKRIKFRIIKLRHIPIFRMFF